MLRRRPLFVLVLLASAVGTAGAVANESDKLALGDPAPQLAGVFVKGEPVTLEDTAGKVRIVEFWATWCAPCRQSIPHLTEIQKRYEENGLVVIGVSDEDEDTVRPFVDKMGDEMDYRVVSDPSRKTLDSYFEPFGVTGIPTAFVVDKEGRLAWYGHPMDPEMEKQIATLLGVTLDDPDAESAEDKSAQEGS